MTDAATKAPTQGSPFWHFSLGFYRLPDVAAACIRLQDEAGVDVNLLFFLLWHASLKRLLSSADIAAAEKRVADWRNTVVIPLRDIRRAMKSAPAMPEPGVAELFRTKVKGLELEAERLQQETLFDLARAAPLGETIASAAEAARANIAAYEIAVARKFPKTDVDSVLNAFASRYGREAG